MYILQIEDIYFHITTTSIETWVQENQDKQNGSPSLRTTYASKINNEQN